MLALTFKGDMVNLPAGSGSSSAGGIVASGLVGDCCVTFGNAVLSGTDNTAKLNAALALAENDPSHTLYIPSPLGSILSNGATLLIGRQYIITTLGAGDDFTNVGGPENVAGTNIQGRFVATGATPATWSHGSVLQELLGTYRVDGDVVWPIGVRIMSQAAPGDIGGPGPWMANPFPVRLVFTKTSGTALYLPQTSSNILWGIEILGNCDCGLGIGGTFVCNGVTNGTTTMVCSGINAYAFKVGQIVTSIAGTDFSANTTVAAVSGAPVRQKGNTTSGVNTILNVSSLTGITAGTLVWGRGIPNGTTVSSASGTTVTLSANATTTDTSVFTFSRADGNITLTLNQAALSSATLVDSQAPFFTDPAQPGTNYPLQPGTDAKLEYCYIHGFGTNLNSNDPVAIRLEHMLLGDAQLCHWRATNVVQNKAENFQFGNDNQTTQAPFGFSSNIAQGGAGTALEESGAFNCLRPIDIAGGSSFSFQQFILQGTYGPVACDVRGSGNVVGDSFLVQNSIPAVAIRLHNGTCHVSNVFSSGAVALSTVTASSTSLTVNTALLTTGMAVTGANIKPGTWITAITPGTPGTVTINQAATSTTTLSLTYTTAAVQTTFEEKANCLPYNANAFVQVIDGTTLLPTANFTYGLTATAITHGNLVLAGTIKSNPDQFGNTSVSADSNGQVVNTLVQGRTNAGGTSGWDIEASTDGYVRFYFIDPFSAGRKLVFKIFNFTNPYALDLAKPLTIDPCTVAALPTPGAGTIGVVSDALAPVIGATVVGGGAITAAVFYTGSAWIVVGNGTAGIQVVADTGWTANADGGDKTASIPSQATVATAAGLLSAFSGVGALLIALSSKVKALETALVAGKLPNA